MKRRARLAAALAATLTVGVVAVPSPALAWAQVNNDPGFIQVYVNNIENLEEVDAPKCPGDWQDLIYYMKTYETSPDLFIVQQLAGPGELNTLIDRMNTLVVGEFDGILAVPDPEQMQSPCGAEKDHQTNAIIWRVGRFDLVSGSMITWQSLAENSSGVCAANHQDRTINMAARLYDKIAGKYVSVGNIHWPTGNNDGPACAPENAAKTVEKVESIPGALHVWGGDANVSDQTTADWRGWYTATNGQLGGRHNYRDAAYDDCSERVSGGAAMRQCLRDTHWTVGGDNRIDFLFARRGDGSMPMTGAEHTVTFTEGNQADIAVTGSDRQDRSYSDHRAIRARIHY
ncbi:hypothetical protein GA0074692_3098 [Micromonospora pallida]|uniref:Endonuclease/Exonuclease/phosphatase family protein n=1 Tax=Micromonospora pallida TaxID=145854 RepID=A0A1C6SPA5_9ACTN|nr:hypothetical protein [Micromonospora pallida]SCL31361.1 hypothetical protein GA0074692_3098 [Micromonospora pallida]